MNDKQREHLHKCAEVLASGYFGSFAAAIGDAMQRADADNLAKLRRAFPDLIQRAGEKLAHDQTRDLFETLGAQVSTCTGCHAAGMGCDLHR